MFPLNVVKDDKTRELRREGRKTNDYPKWRQEIFKKAWSWG